MINWLFSLFRQKIEINDLYFYRGHKVSVEVWEYDTTAVFEISRVGKLKVKGNLYKTYGFYKTRTSPEVTTITKKFLRENYIKMNHNKYKSKEQNFKNDLNSILDEE